MAHNLVDAICSGEIKLATSILVRGTYGNIDSLPANRPGTALFCCCIRGYLPLATLLLEHGGDVESKNENLATPLHGAVDNGHLDIVRLLLSHRADVNAQTRRGDTPLHLAAYRGFPYISQCLVMAGADLTLKNTKFMTPDMEASGQGHSSVAIYLRAALQVVHPEDGKNTKCRSDSLTYLDPPTFFSSFESNDQDSESLRQLDANQQTQVLQGGKIPGPHGAAHNALLWQLQHEDPAEKMAATNYIPNPYSTSIPRQLQANQRPEPCFLCPCCLKRPLQEQQFNGLGYDKCRNRADYEQMLKMNVLPQGSVYCSRQPEQNDENGDNEIHSSPVCMFQHQAQQYLQQQNMIHNQNAFHHRSHHRHSHPPHQLNGQNLLIPHTELYHQQKVPTHHQHIAQTALNQHYQHPQPPMSFLPSIQQHQNLSRTHKDPKTSTQSYQQPDDIAIPIQTAPMTTQILPYDRNTNPYNTAVLRPEILQYNEFVLGHRTTAGFSIDRMFTPVKPNLSPPNVSEGRVDDGRGSLVVNNPSNRESMVHSDNDDDKSYSFGGSSQDSSSFFTLSSLHSLSTKHHFPNKVLRSKSLNHQPELCRDFGGDNRKGTDTTNVVGKSSNRRQNSLTNYIPSGPPLFDSGSLEVQHPSSLSLDSLHSGITSCGSDSSLTEAKRCVPRQKHLSRSASSSPSVAIEASTCVLHPKIAKTLENTNNASEKQVSSVQSGQADDSDRFPRSSIDEGILGNKPSNRDRPTVEYSRRFSLAGTNSVNAGNIIKSNNTGNISNGTSGSFSSSATNSLSSGASEDVKRVCRNHSYESAYGSSNNSLGSSVFDSCGYMLSINSCSDSATDLSGDKELNALSSWQDPTVDSPVAINKASPGALETNQTFPKSTLSVPVVSVRCNSLPTYITAQTNEGRKACNTDAALSRSSSHIDTKKNTVDKNLDENNATKISNVLSQLNNLSLSSSDGRHSLTSQGSSLFDKHHSLPPLMTFINIPTN